MPTVSDYRPDLDAWVSRNFPNADFAAGGGQRLVYRVPAAQASALKIWLVSDEAQHGRHVREVSALGRLSSPGLPRVVAYVSEVEIAGHLFAMYQEQWIDATPMFDLSTPLSPDETQAFLISALEVLQLLHGEGIVHRDVSTKNVLWDGNQAYLIDLGLAKHLDLDSLTAKGVQLPMTLLTASPEQLQGASADLGYATDLFSLGVVAFILATGKHPFIRANDSIFDLQRILMRMHTQDLTCPLDGPMGSVVCDMLHPVAMYRPTAATALQRLA